MPPPEPVANGLHADTVALNGGGGGRARGTRSSRNPTAGLD